MGTIVGDYIGATIAPEIRGTSFWGPYNKDPTISGTLLGSPHFRKLP